MVKMEALSYWNDDVATGSHSETTAGIIYTSAILLVDLLVQTISSLLFVGRRVPSPTNGSSFIGRGVLFTGVFFVGKTFVIFAR